MDTLQIIILHLVKFRQHLRITDHNDFAINGFLSPVVGEGRKGNREIVGYNMNIISRIHTESVTILSMFATPLLLHISHILYAAENI